MTKPFSKTLRLFLYWFPAVLWAGAIFYFSSRPHFELAEKQLLNFILFKFLHLAEYGFLYFLVFRALFSTTPLPRSKILIYSLLIGVVYAVSDEYHQSFVPTREAKIRDVVIDAAGALIAYWVIKTKFNLIKKYVV